MSEIIRIPSEREEELRMLSEEHTLLAEIQSIPMKNRSFAIIEQSRSLLGIHLTADMPELSPETRRELLFVMRALRDAVFTEPSDDTMESR